MSAAKRSAPGRSERPKPGRSKATAGPASRRMNGTQSAECVGLPWTKTVGSPSPSVRRMNVLIPSIGRDSVRIGARLASGSGTGGESILARWVFPDRAKGGAR